MNFDSELLVRLREYLQHNESYVAQELGISVHYLYEIESGIQPIPKALIDFYAQALRVRSSYLRAILSSEQRAASTRPVNKILNKYFGLIQKLKENEEK
ncbi:helix-turn-helix transcriptional regulator [Vibrio cholerae]|uniref:helix-turn-helix domain-containing protein n=1 Tax=Vibrio cholerae TaxID=666 RepID=UPI0000EF8D97|nr:helix-turn-helix transcriptional regulator [Vibrio cholerae]EGQ7642051.1 helix-turn-helix transcriptional regulator [Vibrio cholerae]EGR0495271.1 helix-turn-helix transcriptional regulator [Vibrio cholerae]EJL3955779.1 helix-turn-helix transcriptional regulator [Vibrio cholerae]EJL6357562.1 helix-turn-helix transcriptional regulator [Vibrio cholerae]EJS1626664.1 helix-turn-helix transcriptional regulator [Vibrio cholerae]